MIIITNIKTAAAIACEERIAITRSNKRLIPGSSHMPVLAPSWKLFHRYQDLKKAGAWNEKTFLSEYLPVFLSEMNAPEARRALQTLVSRSNAGERIVLYCFCPDEALCHRAILGKILETKTTVTGWQERPTFYGVSYDWEGCAGTTLAVTGHRASALCGYQREAYRQAVDDLEALFASYYQKGYRTFITGGAQGMDQLAFWALANLRKKYSDIRLPVYVPFSDFGRRWAKTGLFSQSEFSLMCETADEVAVLVPEENLDKKIAISALFARNAKMVEDADLVVGFLNEDPFETSGGTASTMRLAIRLGKKVHQYGYEKVYPCGHETEPNLSIKPNPKIYE